MTFKRQPSMDQAAIDALIGGDVDKSKAIRKLALRNAGAVRVREEKELTHAEDAMGIYERKMRALELGAREHATKLGEQHVRRYHVQIRDPFALPDLPELPELDIPGLNPGYHAPRIPGPEERRRLVGNARFEWFGAPWDSPLCRVNPRRRRVPEARCFGCETPFWEDDQGLALVQTEPEVTTFFHRLCFPVWLKTRRLSLDLGEVLVAIAEQRVVRASDRAGSDRAASEARIRAVEAANAPGDAWESPSWEEP